MPATDSERELLIGTYTRDRAAEGLYRCRFDPATGRFAPLTLAARADNPSYLIRVADAVLGVEEIDDHDGERQGAVCRFQLAGGTLARTARQPTRGAEPAHLASDGEWLAVANYHGGNVAVLPVHLHTGPERVLTFETSGPHRRQGSSHPHGVYYVDGACWAGTGRELWVTDLGGDRIHRLARPSLTTGTPIRLAPGVGPRHLVRARDGSVYVVNELAGTVDVVQGDAVIQTVTVTRDPAHRGGAAGIALTADGASLIVSNRGDNTLARLPVHSATGRLGEARFGDAGGRHPRHFAVVGDWALVANRDTDNLAAVRLAGDGSVGEVADSVHCPAPACVLAL